MNLYHVLRGRSPRRVPAVFWQHILKTRIALIVLTSIDLGIGAFLLVGLLVAPDFLFSAPLAFKIACGVGPMILTFACGRIYRNAKAEYCFHHGDHGHEFCWKCGYDLQGLPAEHRCPE